MQIKPLLDKVVLVPIENEESTSSGILIPSAKEKPNIAVVVAVGEGGFVDGEEVKMIVKVNDTVVYNKYAGTEIKLENKTYVIIKQNDILAIIE